MTKRAVSACLLGKPCRYDGGSKPHATVAQNLGDALPICPECLGGLPIPRAPSEIQGGDGADVLAGRARVMSRDGQDVTEAFLKGAKPPCSFAGKPAYRRRCSRPAALPAG